MGKRLLTMAVAGAWAAPCIALAQANVEAFGRITTAFGLVRYSQAANGVGGISKWDVMQGGSIWGLRGREGLGGGLTAWFEVSQNAPMERSNGIAITPASRNAGVGMRGTFGNLFMGSWYTPWAELDFLWSIGTVGTWGPLTSIIGRRETHGAAPSYNCANLLGVPGTGFGSNAIPLIPTGATAGGAPVATAVAPVAICDALEAGGGPGHPFWRRISNAVFYHSPVLSGVQFKLGIQTNEGRAGNLQNAEPAGLAGTAAPNPWMWSSSLRWSGIGGRARVGVAIDRHKDFTSIGATDSGWAVKGAYNFGVIDIGLAIERMTYRCSATGGAGATATYCPAATLVLSAGDVQAKQWGIAADFPLGAGSIKASYSSAADLTNTAPGTGAKQYNIGYEHRFSKRTSIGAGYAAIQNDSAARFTWASMAPVQSGGGVTPLPGSDPSMYFVTMTHRF